MSIRRRKLIAVLLAALFPGMGHIYLGLFRKGITFILVLLLAGTSLLFFSSTGMPINVPLLILIAMVIPITYFYNVYHVMQSADLFALRGRTSSKQRGKRNPFAGERGLSFGINLLLGGTLLILFYQRPKWFKTGVVQYGGYMVATALIAAAVLLIMKEIRAYRKGRLHAGRMTSALVLGASGVLLLIDLIWKTELNAQMLRWAPLILIMWGLEYILGHVRGIRKATVADQGSRMKLRLDLKGITAAIVIAGSVFLVSQQAQYLHVWNKVSLNLTAASVDYSEEAGHRFIKDDQAVPVALETKEVVVENINGSIYIHREAIEEVQVSAELWVDQITGPEVEVIAEESNVIVSEGEVIRIETTGKAYGQSGKRMPRMNLDIALPDHRRFDLTVRTMNGSISLKNVEAIQTITLEAANGELDVRNVLGDVKGKTQNGSVRLSNVMGAVDVSTNQGNMDAFGVTNSVKLTTQVGNLSIRRGLGDIQLNTKNGNILIDEARGSLKAESLNGGLTIYSSMVADDWSIYSGVGEMNLYLPEQGDYEVDGSISYGEIKSAFTEFQVDHKKVTGQLGEGTNEVVVEGNSNLSLHKY